METVYTDIAVIRLISFLPDERYFIRIGVSFAAEQNGIFKLLLTDGTLWPVEHVDGGGGVGGGGTDNPLWIDQKYKAYEEQELTMTVLSDQDNSVISGNGGSGNSHSR